MPKYKKKITSLMNYEQFAEGIKDLPLERQAFLSILFFSGCRVSEALELVSSNIRCTPDTIYVQFDRLKGSKPTDETPLPKTAPLVWLCNVPPHSGLVFWFSRTTAYRTVKKAFPDLYPHYFRMNRITLIADKFGDATVYSFVGICAQSIDHYRGKVAIGKVGESLKEEVA